MGEIDAAALIRKALSDDVFRVGLARDFDGTVSAHNLNLTSEEARALSRVDWSSPLPSVAVDPGANASWIHIYSAEQLTAGGRITRTGLRVGD
jgi:hypothetical protein